MKGCPNPGNLFLFPNKAMWDELDRIPVVCKLMQAVSFPEQLPFTITSLVSVWQIWTQSWGGDLPIFKLETLVDFPASFR